MLLHAADDEGQHIVGHVDRGGVRGKHFQGSGKKIVQVFLVFEARLQLVLRLKELLDVVRDPEGRIAPEHAFVLEKRHFHRTVPAARGHLEFLGLASRKHLVPGMPECLVRVFREFVHREPHDTASFAEFAHMDEVRDPVAAADDDPARNLLENGPEQLQQAPAIIIPDHDVSEHGEDQNGGKRHGDQLAGIFPAEQQPRIHADDQIVRIGAPVDPEPLEAAGRNDPFRFDRFPDPRRAATVQQTTVKQSGQLVDRSIGRTHHSAGDGKREHRIVHGEDRDVGVETETLQEKRRRDEVSGVEPVPRMEQHRGPFAAFVYATDHFRRIDGIVVDDHAFRVRMRFLQRFLHFRHEPSSGFRASGKRDDPFGVGEDLEDQVQRFLQRRIQDHAADVRAFADTGFLRLLSAVKQQGYLLRDRIAVPAQKRQEFLPNADHGGDLASVQHGLQPVELLSDLLLRRIQDVKTRLHHHKGIPERRHMLRNAVQKITIIRMGGIGGEQQKHTARPRLFRRDGC